MSRLFGYFSDHPGSVDEALRFARLPAVVEAVPRPLGYGVGAAHGTQILLRRRPRMPGAVDLVGAAREVRTNALLVHVRGPVGHAPAIDDTPPFRYGPWMYAHVGEGLPSGPGLREALLETLPDSLRHNVRGTTDDEVFFHLVLSHLRDAGVPPTSWAAAPAKVLTALRGALAHWRAAARDAGADAPPVLAALLTNGQSFYAVGVGRPLHFVGVRRSRGEMVRADAGEARGFVFLAGAEPPGENGWGIVESGSVLWLDTQMKLQRAGLEG